MNIYLTQALHRAIQQHPEQLATRFGQRDRSYAQLAERVARLAGALHGLGVQPGDRVSMLGLNSDRFLEYYLACWWAGAVANPINVRWSAPEMAFSLQDCDTHVLIVDDHFHAMVSELRRLAPALQHTLYAADGPLPEATSAQVHDYEALIARSAPLADTRTGGDALAAIFYTGGTTGKPKGVMLSHANLWASCMARMAQIPSVFGASALFVAPLYHLASAGSLLTQTMVVGASVVLPSFNPAELIACIEANAVSQVTLVPSMIQMLLDSPAFDPARLASLQRITYGASAIAETTLDQAMALLPSVEFAQAYGQTEASPLITLNPHSSHIGEGRRTGLVRAAGQAVLSCEVRIVDENDQEVPRGTVGEICARGPNIMQGYWHRPEETAQALRGGWLHTGDGGYMNAQGYVFVVDRLKDMIVSGGENVYSAEVENAVRSHGDVADCAVIGVPDARLGERVHVAVVLKDPRGELPLDALQAHCRAVIAGYKLPRSMEVLSALPMSAVGKVLKAELRKTHWQDSARAVN